MRKYIILIILFFSSFCIKVKALTYQEIESRDVCDYFELATANSDKTLTTINCYDTYQEALEVMNSYENDDLVILEKINSKTQIIDAKYALVYLGVNSINTNTNYYQTSSLETIITYMNHHPNYGATDGVFLNLNYENHAALVKTNGQEGYIKRENYQIIPLNFLEDINYYQVTSEEIFHYYAKNIETTYTQFKRAIDKKPKMLNIGKYYSYDGNYFYNNLKELIDDYKKGTYTKSVNKDNPYYNYYMYLPHRGISNYSSDDIDTYLKNNRGLIGTVYGNKVVDHYSNMYQTGNFFKSSEYLYGANAILMMSLATNESSLGTSNLAVFKNNLFGHTAYDSDAYNSATGYLNPYQSIIGHAKSYINCGYANPNDYRYYGSNVGNKASGMNIKYASDPYWGEKAANYYYLFDKDNGFLDYNYYQLGITKYSNINTRSEPNTASSKVFSLKYKNVPVIILAEVEGSYYEGSNKWYKIVSDMNLNENRTASVNCTYSNYYNYNSYVYVHSSLIDKINTTYNNKYNSLNQTSNYTYLEYSNEATYTPKVGLITEDTTIYETPTFNISSNKTIKKGHLATIFMEARINNQVVAYLITSDYSKNQKGWVKALDLQISDKDILKVNLNNAGDYLNVFDEINGKVLGSIYTNTYTVITDTLEVNNDLWLKIHYGIDNTYAWLNTTIDNSKGVLEYTKEKLNQAPIIKANNQKIYIYDKFDVKENVTAYDFEDGNLTKDIQVITNNVIKDKPGIYDVTYQVTDSKGETTTLTIQVEVVNYQEGNSLFIYQGLEYVKDNTFSFSGFLGVKNMNNLQMEHYLIFQNEKTQEEYHFKLKQNQNPPYEMSSLDDLEKFDYSGGWFTGEVNLSEEYIPEGDYKIFIQALNKDMGYQTKTYFTNIAYQDMTRRKETSNRGYSFDVDYSYLGSPIIMTIRDEGLLSYTKPTSMDPMYNFFNNLSLDNDNLSILGTSHSAFVSYSVNDVIKREIIFENQETFKRYSFDLGYIDNGLYKVELAVSDNQDKTRAWFNKTINLAKLPVGEYTIYLKTTSNDKTYYGELIDIAYTDFNSINNSKYQFIRNEEKRLRLELLVSID